MRTRADSGFTLPELLMAIMVSSIVIGGLAGVAGSAARTQARDYRHGMVGNSISLGMRYIQTDLQRARQVYTGESTPGTTVIDRLCIGICDPDGVGGADCSNILKMHPRATGVTGPTLNFIYYCRAKDTSDNIWKLYRDSSKTASDTRTCPVYPTCGSTAGMTTISTNVDALKITRTADSLELNRNSVDVQLEGSWYSDSTLTTESVKLKSQITFPGVYLAGPNLSDTYP